MSGFDKKRAREYEYNKDIENEDNENEDIENEDNENEDSDHEDIQEPKVARREDSRTEDSQTSAMSAMTEDEDTQPMGSEHTAALPELNTALVNFAHGMADVNNTIVPAQADDVESVTSSIRSGASASFDSTVETNASNASTEIGAFFAPRIPEININIDVERVGNLFTSLANSVSNAANAVSNAVSLYAAPAVLGAANQVVALPDPVRNQIVELSMAVSMLGLSRYMPNINAYMTTRQNNMINAGVNALLTSVSGIQSSLNSWLLRGGVGITLAVALLRSNIAPSAITRFFTELSVTRAAVYDIMFTFSRSTDDLKLGQNQYDRLKGEYQSAMEALIAAIGNKEPAGHIARLEQAVEDAKRAVEAFIDASKKGPGAASMKSSGDSAGGPGRGVGYGGKRQSQKKQKKQQQQKKQKQQKKTQKQSHKKLSKSKREKKAKQSKKANKKH
jgi:hypothetical protein